MANITNYASSDSIHGSLELSPWMNMASPEVFKANHGCNDAYGNCTLPAVIPCLPFELVSQKLNAERNIPC